VSDGIGQSYRDLAPGRDVTRLGGADRFLVSGAIAEHYFYSPLGNSTTAYIATGENFPDALSGAPLARMTDSPVLLAHKDCIPADIAYRINRMKITKIVLLGGDDVLTPSVAALTVCRP
jgi:putative cell wall-binding protein